MASNYTEHYDLCQWEATDQVQRTDFNADNAKIDAALAEHEAALAARGNCQVYLYPYIGTGESGPVTFTFPHTPIFFTIQSNNETWVCGVRGSNKIHGRYAANSYWFTPLSWGEKTITLGNSDWTALFCCNALEAEYFLVALLDMNE